MFQRRTLLLAAMGVAAVLSGSCSAPSPTVPPPAPAPPDVANRPPTIVSVTASSSRVDAGDSITLTAAVQDAETSTDQLVFEWSAKPLQGTFIGTGGTVTWIAPHQSTTPDTYTFTLKVTEHFTSSGQARENVVSASTQAHYNDSTEEMEDLAFDFLVNRFGVFSVSPQQCVANFSDNCNGKDAELGDIENNRKFFHILSATFTPNSTTFNGSKTTSRVVGPCVFKDIVQATGVHEQVAGDCILTGVYENFRWFLCDSNFSATADAMPISSLRFRVPGVR